MLTPSSAIPVVTVSPLLLLPQRSNMSQGSVQSRDRLYRIATIPGDGIGTEITAAAIQVLRKLADVSGSFRFDFTHFDWSSKTFKERGYYIPDDGFARLKEHDAIYFGAVGWPGASPTPRVPQPLHARL